MVGCGPDEPTLARPYAIATFSKILSAGTVITSRHREPKMKDMQAHLEKLRVEAEECELISKLATNPTERTVCQAGGPPPGAS
ncbi:hypothetical protein ACVIIY_007610 [Bradyrhizobium sp. USDA 4515]